jgi:tetratricopeptide (TPR) repeat protein
MSMAPQMQPQQQPQMLQSQTSDPQDPNQETTAQLFKLAEYYAQNQDYNRAIEYFTKLTDICKKNGCAWTALGHLYLLKEDLQKSFSAYQYALYYLDNIYDP